ncbi:unnamed protein product [Candida verbasci]|uniref:Na+/H+ antiporter n=1 Tax=Candida verbasci TaxID=1227364 RepID=A0A9W4TYS5_9ASCO|nr:unnamed protein product [Candida verbasci]
MAWSQLELEAPHIAYACVGIFSTLFSLVSLFVKERLYIGEATVATIAGLILGPHCLNWFNPISWGNSDYITLEICRIVLCIQIVAVAVELPRKYMKKHWLSVAIFLLPVMTCGWLIVGLFIWVLIPHFNFADALLVSACVTATDPVLAAAVVGKGKFAERVPGHLRNLLSAESGCNDGMAFPFIYLSLFIIIYKGNAREIVKDWFCLTILWECIFGCVLGAVIGFVLRKLVAFAEDKNLIDRESFLAIFVFIAFISAGIGSMLGVDDLLVSFAAGTAFGWNGAFARKTEESHVSTVIDLLLNLSFFVYFGAIVPWPMFNQADIGLNVWRLIILAFVIIFLRRIPAVVALKPFTPDVKTWREAFFCGHFGPIGVGAIFASILARKDLEGHYTTEETPLHNLPNEEFPHYQLLSCIWPMVCFIVITSIIVHGSSVAVLTLGKRLNRMAITMSFTTTNGETTQGTSNWMQRLQKLDKSSTSFSLHRVDTAIPKSENDVEKEQVEQEQNLPETSGIKFRPAGGAKRKKKRKSRQHPGLIQKTLSKVTSNTNEGEDEEMERHRPAAQFLQLGQQKKEEPDTTLTSSEQKEPSSSSSGGTAGGEFELHRTATSLKTSGKKEFGQRQPTEEEKRSVPTNAYQEGDRIVIEDQYGEVMDNIKLQERKLKDQHTDEDSIHSMDSLQRQLTQYSSSSSKHSTDEEPTLVRKLSRTLSRKQYHKKSDPKRKVFAHRIDNLIVIENEEGDIIRRYKVNKHASTLPKPNRSRSSTLVGKMKSLVGISNQQQQQPEIPETPTIHVTDLEKGSHHQILIPEGVTNDMKDSKMEQKLENKITSILEKKHESGSHKLFKNASPPPPVNDVTEEEDDEEETETDLSDYNGETAVEKKRRLQALGHLPTGHDENDEEE